MKKKIGFSIGNSVPIEHLSLTLENVCQYDVEYVELVPNIGPVLIGGKLNKHALKAVKSILGSFPLGYTVHCPGMQNLRDVNNLELQHNIFKSSLDFTREIGASVYVAHFSKMSEDLDVEKRFEESMYEMAEYAKDIGVVIGVENIEVERVQPVLNLLEMVDMESMKMTLDFGHAYISSKLYGYDFLKTVELTKPYLAHMHIHDNLGNPDEERMKNRPKPQKDRLTLGLGDLHIPIGWGEIPYKQVFDIIRDDYDGIYMMEHNVGVSEHFFKNTLNTLNGYIE